MVEAVACSAVTGRLEERDRAAADRLVEVALGRPGGASVRSTFPLLLAEQARALRLVVRNEHGIVAHAASRELVVDVTEATSLRLANIGAVVTDATQRGRGYASLLVTRLIEEARAADCDGVVLWSGEPEFYERLGFRSCGTELLLVVERAALVTGHGVDVRTAGAPDLVPQLEARARRRPRVRRSLADALLLARHGGSRRFVVEKPGVGRAYVAVGKGLDYLDCVSDRAGPSSLVAAGLAGVLDALHLDRIIVPAGSGEASLIDALGTAVVGCVPRSLALLLELRAGVFETVAALAHGIDGCDAS